MKKKLCEEHLPSKALEIDMVNDALKQIPFLGFETPETFGDKPIDISGELGIYPEDINRAVDGVQKGLFESFNLKIVNESYYEVDVTFGLLSPKRIKELESDTGVLVDRPMHGSLVVHASDKKDLDKVLEWLQSKGFKYGKVTAFESNQVSGTLLENVRQRVKHVEAIVADLKRDLKEKRRLKTRAENQMRVPDAHKLTTEVEDLEAELADYEKKLGAAKEWVQKEDSRSKKRKLTEAPQLTLSMIDKLANMGGGFGYFGNSIRDPRSYARDARSLVDVIDKAFLDAAKTLKLELWHVAAFGDSKEGRWLGDDLSSLFGVEDDKLTLDKSGKKGTAKSTSELAKMAKEKIIFYMQKFFKSLKREDLDDLQRQWLERFKEAGLK